MAPPCLRDIPLNVETLRRRFSYDPATGLFSRKVAIGNTKPGAVLETIDSVGYIAIGINYKKYRAHRLAWLYMTGEWPSVEIDHIDRNKLNNRFSNLRLATRRLNACNIGMRSTNKSGYMGVSWNERDQKWRAQIVSKGRSYYLGAFYDAKEAAQAYEQAALKLHEELWSV